MRLPWSRHRVAVTATDAIQTASDIASTVNQVAQSLPYVGAIAGVLQEIANIMAVGLWRTFLSQFFELIILIGDEGQPRATRKASQADLLASAATLRMARQHR